MKSPVFHWAFYRTNGAKEKLHPEVRVPFFQGASLEGGWHTFGPMSFEARYTRTSG